MASNNEDKQSELVLWEDELERAAIRLAEARHFDDHGAITWNEEMIRWARIKIAEIEDYLDIQKGA